MDEERKRRCETIRHPGATRLIAAISGAGPLLHVGACDNDKIASPPGTAAAGQGATPILFMSGRDGNREVYVMNADGSGQTDPSHSADEEGDPDWRWSR